jgi:chromosome segregation protein
MYLRRLELQGFKTFASKTTLEFQAGNKAKRGLTGIVGPNGSGKSNIADAIRWVMGEQSMKLLRGKKSEDVIFSGSDKKSRSGFAEVSLILENDQTARGEQSELPHEVVVTRRLYRDGKSDYEVNRQAARHTDVLLLLAQCGIGQRTYSVIGQGMVDAILVATPADRKEFFDEAAGLRPFQLKRNQAVNKLETSKQNLLQAEALVREIGPRLTTLERQMNRLKEKSGLEAELADLEKKYYGGSWHEIFGNMSRAKTQLDKARAEEAALVEEAKKLEAELGEMERAVPASEGFDELRKPLDAIAEERAALREKQATLQAQLEIAKVRNEKPWAPLPLSKIIENIEGMGKQVDGLLDVLSASSPDVKKAHKLAEDMKATHSSFVSKLQAPAPEPSKAVVSDPRIQKELDGIAQAMTDLTVRAQKVQNDIEQWKKKEDGKRVHLFDTQRALGQKRGDALSAERRANEASVEMARWETRRDTLLNELRAYHADWEKELNQLAQESGAVEAVETLHPRIVKVRSQLEWIGGIDPETEKEYNTAKERFEFLSTQSDDLKGAINGLETVIQELDETIKARSEASFHSLNREFGKYFQQLFGGGEAKLLQLEPEPVEDDDGNIIEGEVSDGGIDIQATPPGKRLKNIALLSGGEKALTSIALICAIMATNPSPFVVLDEVDAALDEANSKKYAEILQHLSDKTQFVVVTHNRATMHQANVLYGVTMGEDGTSQILSVKLEEM